MLEAFSSQATVLGKRKAKQSSDKLVLHLTSPSLTSTKLSSGPGSAILVNGSLIANTAKRYRCTQHGCEKSYSKPSRLEEHERSHTGQRPYVCETCGKSYLRETHLHAHTRSHLPNDMRPFVCEKDGCAKRFWTSQHLQVHHSWHEGVKPYKCQVVGCEEAFAKHHLLRSHVCLAHAPPGTKPYRCDHEGCSKSFNTNQHLHTHQKTHDTNRYTCVHPACISEPEGAPRYFTTWSSLQSHIRKDHPPTCTHSSCKGKTFSNQGNLRAHLKLHEQRGIEAEIEKKQGTDVEDDGDPPSKRRRGGEYGRDWTCNVGDCDKDFKSTKALQTHINVSHLGRRDFVCHHKDCTRAFGYKHLLRRHVAKVHLSDREADTSSPDSEEEQESQNKAPGKFDIDMITGYSYTKQADADLKSAKVLRCPCPDFTGLLSEEETQAQSFPAGLSATPRQCEYVFSRAYDFKRHLAVSHSIVLSKEVVDGWVKKQKRSIVQIVKK